MSNLFKKIVLSFFILMLVLLCAAVAVAQFLKLQKQAEAIKTQKQTELVLKSQENELEKKISDLEEEIAKITHQSETTKRNAAQKIEAQTKEQQEQIKNLQDSLASLEKEKIILIRQIAKVKKEKEEIKHERDKLAKESSKNLLKQEEDLNKERQRAEKSKQELELRLVKASGKKEIAELKEKISKTSSSLNESNAQIKALNKQLNQVKTELKDASKQNEDASKQNKELILEAEKLKISNQQIRAQFSPLQQLNNQLEKKAGELYIQAQDAKQIPSFQNSIETLTRERGVLADRIKDLEVEIEKINKSRAAQLRDLAWAYMKIREFEPAIDFYSQSLSLDPDSAEAHYRLGLLYEHKAGEVKKSIFHLKRYLALEPKTTKRQEIEYMINMLSANGPDKWRKP